MIHSTFQKTILFVLSSIFCITLLFGNISVFTEEIESQINVEAVQSEQVVDTVPVPAPEQVTKLGVRVIAPFVNKDIEGNYSGFSIDLWKMIAKKAELNDTKYFEFGNVGDLVSAIEKKELDAGIAAISITSDREARVDFSQPMFDSGLGILVPGNTKQETAGPKEFFTKIFNALWNRQFLYLTIAIVMLGFVLANIAYLLERIHPDGVFSKNYLVGVSEAFWWSMSALASQADHNPRTRQGKTLAVIWMYFSVIFLTFFQAQVTSDLTAQKLNGEINGINDLAGKNVISVVSSTASNYLKEKGVTHTDKANLKEAMEIVASGQADALVFDSPALNYYANNEGNGKAHLVGETFKPENYGIAFPQGSAIRTKVNLALLQLKEDGSYKELYTKYFGEKK